MEPEAATKSQSRWHAKSLASLYVAALLCCYVVLIFAHRQPPLLGDLCDWVYEGALLARHIQGLPDPTHVLKHYPVPNSMVTVVIALLVLIFPWTFAIKVFVAGQLSLAFLAIRSLARVAGTPSLIYLIAPSAVFLGVNFWYGFAAFQLGLTLLLFFIALLLRDSRGERQTWVIAFLLLALFFTHMVPFSFACLLLVLSAVQERRVRRLWQILPSAICLGLYTFGRFSSGDPDELAVVPGSLRYGSASFFLYKLNSLGKSFGLVNPVDAGQHSLAVGLLGKQTFIMLFCINVVVAFTCLLLLVRSAKLGRQGSKSRCVWIAIILVIPVYLLMPQTMLGISDPGSRVLQTAICVSLFFCTDWRVAWRVAAGGSVVLAMAGVLLFAQLAGAPPQTNTELSLPAPVELLAKAPYAYGYQRYLDISTGHMNESVFPTGLFTNREPQTQATPGQR